MCGLVGLLCVSRDAPRIDPDLLAKMRDTMAHRGPDGVGLWVADDARVAMAHRRLAIIDPSEAAGQPMATADGRWTIVFNGEIYNHADLRRELPDVKWQTDHSDTEVLLQAFARWGLDALPRLRGMFAFAIWDAETKQMWLVRDRIGIKPMYWTLAEGRFGFASEIKALLADPSVPRQVDEEALFHYLSFLTTPAPQTLFKGIRKLAAGTWLRVDSEGEIVERRWWDAWDEVDPRHGIGLAEAGQEVLAELRTAVALRKVSDVPVGVFLSGGLDSSINTALFSEGEDRPVETFTIGYSDDHPNYSNEAPFARMMADHVGANFHETLLDAGDLEEFLPRMVELQDEPIADPVCVPVYYLARAAREAGVPVCQLGEGADELFLGYPWWQRMLRLQSIVDRSGPRQAKALGAAGLRAAGRRLSVRYEYLSRAGAGWPVFWSGAEAFTHDQKLAMLAPRVRQELAGLSSFVPLEAAWHRYQARCWDKSPLNWMAYADLTIRLPELLLMRVDKMTMGTSLEARVPFLDHRVVETALGIPASVRGAGPGMKPVLKQAVRGLVPDQIVDRPKQGFAVPIRDYLGDRLGAIARREIKSFVDATDLFDWNGVERVLSYGAEGVAANSTWYLFNLALWWRSAIAS